MTDRVCVAQIGAPHGVRGEVRLWTFTADPMAVTRYAPLQTEDGKQAFEIEAVRPAKGHLVARLRGIDTREAAERLTNIKLFVLRERLPQTEADEFYHADLVGLAAVTADGNEVGTVVAIHDFGAGDILELRPRAGGPTLMLPFSDTYVPEVDVPGRRIVVAPLEDVAAKRGDE